MVFVCKIGIVLDSLRLLFINTFMKKTISRYMTDYILEKGDKPQATLSGLVH